MRAMYNKVKCILTGDQLNLIKKGKKCIVKIQIDVRVS